MLPIATFSIGKSRSAAVSTLTDLSCVSDSSMLSTGGAASEPPFTPEDDDSGAATAPATPTTSFGGLR
jgi:hypothetical protein